jgi:hypothetical protein
VAKENAIQELRNKKLGPRVIIQKQESFQPYRIIFKKL